MNISIVRIVSLFVFFFLSAAGSVTASEKQKFLGLGINYPGINIKWLASDKFALEGKYQSANDISVAGLRGYYYLNPSSLYMLFVGIEGDRVTFDGDDSKGNGIAGEIFFGLEYPFSRSMTFQFDVGPAFISLEDDSTNETETGLEGIVNFGIYYYFGKEK